MSAISIRGLYKRYGDIRAVDGIDLDVGENEIFGILGPNGAGKTTTLEMVETLRDPDAGEIKVLGLDVRRDSRKVKEIIGVQLQNTVFFEYLTVRETVDLFAAFYTRRLPVDELIDLVELKDKAGERVENLSGGQHKRLSIALALVNDPRIVFLDEPTTGLDPQARRRIWEIIRRLREERKTVVLTTHYIEEAERLCDRVAVMDHGRIIALGTPSRLIDEHVDRSTITFRLHPPLDPTLLKEAAGVEEVSAAEGVFTVLTSRPQESLMGIISLAEREGSRAEDINMRRATLEDVFLKLTGRRIRS
jgi:ABC-2 type transport system ATP-binding protein